MPYFSAFKRKILERSIMMFFITSLCGFNYFALIEKPLDALICSVLSMILTGQYYTYMNLFGIQISKIELVRLVADGQPLPDIGHVKITSQTGEWGIVRIEELRPLSSQKDKFLRNQKFPGIETYMKNHFPIWVGDIVLYAQRQKALVRDINLFRAVVNGR